MARKIKISRKKIKKPDEFLGFSDRAWKYLSDNRTMALGIAGGIIFVLLAAGFISYAIKDRQERAGMLLGDALSVLGTPVASEVGANQMIKERKVFDTMEQKNAEAIKKLAELVGKYGGTDYGIEGRFHLGDLYFQTGDYQNAVKSYEEFIKKMPGVEGQKGALEYSANLGLAKSYYELKNYEKAGALFQKLLDAKETSYLPEALLGQARLFLKTGKTEQAKQNLDKLVKDYAGGIYAHLAKQEILNLEKPSQEAK